MPSVDGRPPQINNHLLHLVCDMLAAGATIVDASEAVGVPERTLRRWIAYGRRGDALTCVSAAAYRRLAESVEAAKVEHRARVREAIQDALRRTPIN